MFVQAAGRGLAAAHHAGLVHRDFKPENVLIGDDGLARVVDFGLARRSPEDELLGDSVEGTQTIDPEFESIASVATRSLEISLTGTGRNIGTPAYMAPEQLVGELATVRSDQFAFCVALWEALYGMRPFAGRDLPSLTANVTSGKLSALPSEGPYAHYRVPSHVHRAIVRGLSTRPDERFARLDDLLEALTHDPLRRRRRIATIVGANLLGGSIVFTAGMWVADSLSEDGIEATSCQPERMLAGVWDAKRQASVNDRFTQIDAPFAEHSARELKHRLDAYASQWLSSWRETCEAERTLGPSAELEAQRDCLGQRLGELEAFTEALIGTSIEDFANRAEHAVAAAEALAPIAACRDPSRLRADTELSPEQRARATSLRTRLSEATAAHHLGDRSDGLAQTRELLDEARELDSPRIAIRALVTAAEFEQLANEHDSAVTHLQQAYSLAEHHGEDWLRAEAAVSLIGLLGWSMQRPREAEVWEQVSGALLQRIGDPPDLRGRWHYQVGNARMRQSELEDAQQAYDRALDLHELAFGRDSREVEKVLQRLGTVARERGDYERAVAYHTRLLTRRTTTYGPDHPDVAAVHGSLGNDAYFRGDYAQARQHYEEALRIIGECYGEDSPAYAPKLNNYAAVLERLGELDEAEAIQRKLLGLKVERYGERDIRVTSTLENLGLVLLTARELDEAAELFRRSLAIRTEHHGDEHVATATSKLNLGYTLHVQGDRAGARALYDQALATWIAKLGDAHPDLALAYGNIGDLDLDDARLGAARRNYERALDLTREALGEDAADLGYYLTGLARVDLAEGDIDGAIEHGQRALELRRDSWLPPGDRGLTQLTLSRALHRRGAEGDRTRARDLALLAREDIRASKDAERLKEVLVWLDGLEP